MTDASCGYLLFLHLKELSSTVGAVAQLRSASMSPQTTARALQTTAALLPLGRSRGLKWKFQITKVRYLLFRPTQIEVRPGSDMNGGGGIE